MMVSPQMLSSCSCGLGQAEAAAGGFFGAIGSIASSWIGASSAEKIAKTQSKYSFLGTVISTQIMAEAQKDIASLQEETQRQANEFSYALGLRTVEQQSDYQARKGALLSQATLIGGALVVVGLLVVVAVK